MSKTIIFTDGSSRGNPGDGGFGAIVAYRIGDDKMIKEIGGYEKNTTNNRMEMTSVIEALIFVLSKTDDDIVIYTDSEYVKKGATEWVYAWASNNWLTKANSKVLNQDLWQKMLSLISKLEVSWCVIPGHSGIPANERCDEIATSFADRNDIVLFDGRYEDYKISLDIKSGYKNTSKNISSKSLSKKAYSYVSFVEGKVAVHKTWKECEDRVKGKRNARYRKALSKDQELDLITEFSQ